MLGNFTTNLREVIFGTKLALLFPAVPLAVVADFYSFGRGPVTRTMSKRLQEDWARAAEEGPRILKNLRTHLLLEVASPLSLPSPFRCHSSSKKQRNPLMKKILGLQAPMELTSCGIKSIFI
ncbi:hypothetical protein D0Y65_030587 [Glycine soja]|uniref:Uncharacterized protein n=1 Tax=Glycine soja TaxID=3848 RepID=A0A445I4M0_GLYSO|nr:hypothetical protein D0Y65_030587 [Glycine soja]